MYKLSQAAALAFTLLITGIAQAGEGGKGHGGDRLARMQEHLGLSDDQVSQIREIRANGGGREEISEVLTEDQRTQLQEHRAQRQERKREHHQRQDEV